ncbi:MAG: arginine N-succinyltransferase [Motiliproteus sp.]|jgi:arginine N-succinyltransferase
MLLIRPSELHDLDALLAISRAVGPGMTSMPADADAWQEKLLASQRAFSAAGAGDAVSTYFMVLEDHQTGRILGTTAIYTGIGLRQPFYSYQVSTLTNSSRDLAMTRQASMLSLVSDYNGATEIGSLFLLPEYRQPGVGQFLSRGRFLLLADFPQRFGAQVMAELRGWQDEQGQSPLWEHLGSKFFGIDFQEAVQTAALKGSQFISDMMPKYPIYIDLLPQAAREVIGKPHTSSAAALHMLKKEGFEFSGYVDLFDGGPSVQTQAQDIYTVRASRTAACRLDRGAATRAPADEHLMLLSNARLDRYRLALAPARLDAQGELLISPQTAAALQVTAGDPLRYISSTGSACGQANANAVA